MADRGYDVERERDLTGPTLLRVHGVGAAPPERLLDTHEPVLVAGDAIAGFYRRPREEEESDPDPHALEAYSWGGLTARGTGIRGLKKALWVFLLPFALINTARWMIPERPQSLPPADPREGSGEGQEPPTEEGARSRMTRSRQIIVDLLAYLTTVGFFSIFYAIVVDGIGLNCLIRRQPTPCAKKLGLGWFSEIESLAGYPSRMLVVSLIPVVIVMIGFWLLAARGSRDFHLWAGAEGHELDAEDLAGRPRIGNPALWSNDRRVAVLGSLHLAGTLSMLTVAFVAAAGELDGEMTDLQGTIWLIAAVLFVVAGGASAFAGLKDRFVLSDHAERPLRWLVVTSAVLAVVAAWSVLVESQPISDEALQSLAYDRIGIELSFDADAAAAALESEEFTGQLGAIRDETIDYVASFTAEDIPEGMTEDEYLDVLLFEFMIRSLEAFPTADELELLRPIFEYFEGSQLPAWVEIPARIVAGEQYLEEVFGREGGWYYQELDIKGIQTVYAMVFVGVGLPVAMLLLALFALMILPPRNRQDGALGFGPPMLVVIAILVGYLGLMSLSRWMFVYLDVSLTREFLTSSLGVVAVLAIGFIGELLIVAGLWLFLIRRPGTRLTEMNEEYWKAVKKLDHADRRVVEAPQRTLPANGSWLRPLYLALRVKPIMSWIALPMLAAAVAALVLPFWVAAVDRLFASPLFHSVALLFSIVYLPTLLLIVWRSRRVGHLWDVLTFWPRDGHPFAPPGYAHRAVPEITTRIIQRLQFPDPALRPVVIAGHSQGSVIAAAVVSGLPAHHLPHIGLLTYGSPLTQLYRRFFPTYFGTDQMRRLELLLTDDRQPGGEAVVRWRNLYRRSDPIGGPVFDQAGDQNSLFRDIFIPLEDPEIVDVASPDPFPGPAPPPGDPMPQMRGHSDYEYDPPYRECLVELWEMLEPDNGPSFTEVSEIRQVSSTLIADKP